MAEAKTMSYFCRDTIAFLSRAEIRRVAEDIPALAPFFLESSYFQLPIGPRGCRIWDVGRAEPEQPDPPASRIPTLVLAGEYDTGAPAFFARQMLPNLQRFTYHEFPAADHLQLSVANFASDCARSIAERFLDRPRRKPDAACVGGLSQFDFTPPTTAQRRERSLFRPFGPGVLEPTRA